MSTRFFVTANHRGLRIYREESEPGQSRPRLALVDGVEFLDGQGSYVSQETDVAGRFPNSGGQPTGQGMSVDERLSLKEEQNRRLHHQIAHYLNSFFAAQSQATWNLAAGPSLLRPLLDRLRPEIVQQLDHSIAKELVNTPAAELREYFF